MFDIPIPVTQLIVFHNVKFSNTTKLNKCVIDKPVWISIFNLELARCWPLLRRLRVRVSTRFVADIIDLVSSFFHWRRLSLNSGPVVLRLWLREKQAALSSIQLCLTSKGLNHKRLNTLGVTILKRNPAPESQLQSSWLSGTLVGSCFQDKEL